MPRPDFFTLLNERVIINDGGMGTQLIAAGMPMGYCSEKWNLEQPEVIMDVHRRYAEAGCDLLTTNSFGGTRTSLANHGSGDDVETLNRKATELAKQAGGDRCIVMGDVGPFGGFLEPMGTTTPEELADIFAQQIIALKAGGADGINIETMSDPNEIILAIKAARAVDANWPVLASFCFQKAGEAFRTMMGTDVETAMKSMIDAGADVVGTNCGTDLSFDDYVDLARQMVEASGDTPVIISANAGQPELVDGEATYQATPDDMAAYAKRVVETGVNVVGGCCGTTPAHLAAVAAVLKG